MRSKEPESTLTAEQRWRQCERKHRWPDELMARAGALHVLEAWGLPRMYIYKCSLCNGWHLTKLFTASHLKVTLENPCPKAN